MTGSLFQNFRKIYAISAVLLLSLAVFNVVLSESEIDLSPLASDIPSKSPFSSKDKKPTGLTWDVSFPETLERPLFSPTRRDFVPTVPTAEAVEEVVEEVTPEPRQRPRLTLQGTRSIAGRTSALVALKDQGTRWVSIGDEVFGWAVTEIGLNSMVLVDGSERLALKLYPTAERN